MKKSSVNKLAKVLTSKTKRKDTDEGYGKKMKNC